MADNKKLREKRQKQAAQIKEQQKNSDADRSEVLQKMQDKHSEYLKDATAAIKKGDTVNAARLNENAAILKKVIDKGGLGTTNKNLKSLLSEIEYQDTKATMDENLLKEEKSREKALQTQLAEQRIAAAGGVKGLNTLTDTIKLENAKEVAREKLGRNELGKRLKDLGSVFGSAMNASDIKRAKELKEQYKIADETLKAAMAGGNEEEIQLAQEQVDKLDETVGKEEDKREQSKKADIANSRLKTLSDISEKTRATLVGMAKGGSFIGGIIGIAMAIFSPEKFKDLIMLVLDKVVAVFDTVVAFLEGDFTKAGEIFKENIKFFGALIGGVLIFFGPQLIGALIAMLKVVKTVSLFMRVTIFPALASAFTGILSALGISVTGLLPAIAIGAAIVAVIGVFVGAFLLLKKSLGPGATIMDTLTVAFMYFVDFLSLLVNGITFLPRKVFQFLGKRAAKWLFGDKVDTSFFDSVGDGLRTDRGKEARENAKAAAAERMKLEAQEELEQAAAMKKQKEFADKNSVANTGDISQEGLEAMMAKFAQDTASAKGDSNVAVTNTSTTANKSDVQIYMDTNGTRTNEALAAAGI